MVTENEPTKDRTAERSSGILFSNAPTNESAAVNVWCRDLINEVRPEKLSVAVLRVATRLAIDPMNDSVAAKTW